VKPPARHTLHDLVTLVFGEKAQQE
jgi:hypothetical protein